MAKVILEAPDGQKLEIEGPNQEGAIQKARLLSQRMKQAFAERGQGIPDPIVPQQTQPQISGTEAFNRQGAERFTGNLSNLADFVLNPQTQFGPQEFTTRSGAPVRAVPTVPLPSGEQIVGGAEAGLGGLGSLLRGKSPQFGERFQQSLERGERAEREQPMATAGGDVAGDILTLSTGRAPFAKPIGQTERSLMATRTAEELLAMPPTAKREILRVLNSSKFRKLVRGAGRAGETGIEGAVLAIANDGDPMTTAGLAAGGQAAGSAMLTISKEAFDQVPGGIGFKLVGGSMIAGGMFALLNSAVPGGEDNLLDDFRTGFDKTVLTLVLGGAAAAAGTGRIRGQGFAESFPKLTDAITNIGRGTFLSLAEEYSKAEPTERQEMEAVIRKVGEDPTFFDQKTRNRIQRVFTEKKGSLKKTIDSLKKDPDFKLRLDSLTNKDEQDVPANVF